MSATDRKAATEAGNDTSSMHENHYVLIVHGTWNSPEEGKKSWHQLDESDPENFCRRLNDVLERYGMGRPVWANSKGKVLHFSWTGANRHKDRLEAANGLLKLVLELQK